jgi:hypothetical protein
VDTTTDLGVVDQFPCRNHDVKLALKNHISPCSPKIESFLHLKTRLIAAMPPSSIAHLPRVCESAIRSFSPAELHNTSIDLITAQTAHKPMGFALYALDHAADKIKGYFIDHLQHLRSLPR